MSASAGDGFPLYLNVYNEENGVLIDPDSVQLDITYGEQVGFAPDVGGPYFYQGAGTPTPGQVWRIGTGQYGFIWDVPYSIETGVYVANWTVGLGSDTLLTVENFPVQGGYTPAVPAGDTGFWTGGLIYPAAGLDIKFGTVDANGIAWLWNKIEGWDGPDVQGAGVIAKSGDHGAWASPQYYAARNLTLTVTATAPDQAARDLARSLLQQAVPVSDLATLRYDEPTPKQALVRRSGKVTESYTDLCAVQFVIGLVAPDPRKYSTQVKNATTAAVNTSLIGVTLPFTLPVTLPSQLLSGSLAVLNAGNFETRPVIVINGPITAPSLTNVTTGQTVSWSGLTVPAGWTLTADFNVMQAQLAQAGQPGAYRSADAFSSWWTLPPGESTLQLSGQADTGASMTVRWSDAWI